MDWLSGAAKYLAGYTIPDVSGILDMIREDTDLLIEIKTQLDKIINRLLIKSTIKQKHENIKALNQIKSLVERTLDVSS